MSSNSLVFHTSGGISSNPTAFLFLIFLSTESSSSWVNGSSLMSNCLIIILVIGSCVTVGLQVDSRRGPARTYVLLLCEDTGCSPEDLSEVMNDREEWRERVRDIRAGGTTWWWWWWWDMFTKQLIRRWFHYNLNFRFGSVSLFIGISTFVGYLMPKPSVKKNSNGTI